MPSQHLPSPVYLSRPKTPQLQQSPVPMQQHTFTTVVAPTVNFPTDTVVTPSTTQTQNRQSSYIVSTKPTHKILTKSETAHLLPQRHQGS